MVERLGLPERECARLYEAVASLTEYQRMVIERFYGLGGRPQELLVDINFAITGKVEPQARAAWGRKNKGLKALRRRLEEVA